MSIKPTCLIIVLFAVIFASCKSQEYITVCYKPGKHREGYSMNISRTKQVSYIYDGSDFCYFFEYSQDTISSYLFIEYADNSFNGGWQFIINNMLEKYGEQAYKMLNPDTAEYVASYLGIVV